MGGTTPLLGIHYPSGTTKAVDLGTELEAMAGDVERALIAGGIPPVTPAPVMVAATAAARDAFWGVPANETARRTLQNRGATTVRTDKGWTERYYATYDATTNPGGVKVAGWYPVGGSMPQIDLYPSGAQVVNSGSLISAWSAPGSGDSIAFGGAEWFSYGGGIITVNRTGVYSVSALVSVSSASGAAAAFFLTRNGNSSVQAQDTVLTHSGYGTMAHLTAAGISLDAGDTIRVYLTAATQQLSAPQAAGRAQGEFSMRFVRPR
ncbi:hypothetical protein [Microbacterium sp. cx-55]|uniref:hypothetical protein n=1 Tax=Microbacterium sp. cx-55 TaxID=2875948 RepID=UPI001CBB71F9|nr:hypothetical protein [Microbacterium sp. cx-55]MBZ4486285.1 hypothetical protein [Microbacterium sp. cx-55]